MVSRHLPSSEIGMMSNFVTPEIRLETLTDVLEDLLSTFVDLGGE